MKAAHIIETGSAPVYVSTKDPVALEGESVITVTAAPISPIVRLRASTPVEQGHGLAVGLDGVGTDESGRRVYFLFPKAPFGALAERTLVPVGMTVPVPDGLDDAIAAAVATAGMASWVALTRRVPIYAGQTVLVTAANGSAGHLALQVAHHLDAGQVIGVVRSTASSQGVAADRIIALDAENADAELGKVFRKGVDIVLDFAWGDVAARIIAAATAGRGSPVGERRLRYAVIGATAGHTAPIAAYGLQSSGLEIIGSGIGSVSVQDYLATCTELFEAARTVRFTSPHIVHPLSEISSLWDQSATRRIIIRP